MSKSSRGEIFERDQTLSEQKPGSRRFASLFAIFMAAMLHLGANNLPQGVQIVYRTDGRLLNFNQCAAKTKVLSSTVMELQ